MKRIYQLIVHKLPIYCSIFFLSICLVACTKLFEPENFSCSNIQNDEQLEQLMGGVTNFFKDYYNKPNSCIHSIFGDDLFLECPYSNVDDVTYLETIDISDLRGYMDPYNSFYSKISNYDRKETTGFNFELKDWDLYYRLIASINNVLTQFDLSKNYEKERLELLGEFYFYRAFFYYQLSRIYGRIPLVDNIDVNYTLKKPSYNEVYEFIEADLLQAIKLLPGNSNLCRIPYETPHRGTAKALLGEVYLTWAGNPANNKAMYYRAVEITTEVMDSAFFFGFELLPDFEDLWNKKGRYNKEAIFCIYYQREYQEINLFSQTKDGKRQENSFLINPNSNIRPFSILVPEIQFYNQFPVGYRKDITFFTQIYVPPLHLKFGVDTGYVHIDKVDSTSQPAYRKFFIDTLLLDSKYVRNANTKGCPKIYFLRYAQTLLTFAEASARSGKLDANAYECVNKVRRRANRVPLDQPSEYDLPMGLSEDAFVDSVVMERAWEFAAEPDHRWNDMVRTQTVEKVYEQKDPYDGGGQYIESTNEKYFFPIPESDIGLNPNFGD